MKRNIVFRLSLMSSALILSGCASTEWMYGCEKLVSTSLHSTNPTPRLAESHASVYPLPLDSADQIPWIRSARHAADQLACGIPVRFRSEPILVATLVDINSLKSDSQIGRVLSEQISSRLARLGYPVIEVRLRDSLTIKDGVGEQMLSRQLSEIGKQHKTPLAVVGTFTETVHSTVVNLKAVRTVDGVSIASSDFAVSNDADIVNMMATQAGVSKEILEAMKPVRAREFKVRP